MTASVDRLTAGRSAVTAGIAAGVPGLRAAAGDDGVAVLLVDRPAKRNALTLAMWAALPDLLAGLASDPRVRVLLVSGAGDTFSAGADIAELREVYADPGRAEAYHATNVAAEEALAGFPWPTLAVVRGACVGGGCQLAVACDIRLADPGARFGLTPAKLGVVYPAAPAARLTRLLGPARAKYLLFSGELVTASRAAAFGLVEEVVPDGGLEFRALTLARTIAGHAALSVRAAKAAVAAASAGADVAVAVDPWQRESLRSAEVAQRLAAFLQPR
ncbi:MAG TPA: enoyl-CoA hydratase/isomerase family protein [Pilimelia sp.]|nr:enoyl-CoA hydratase/isomerase family protein [Pilimelia sp.]